MLLLFLPPFWWAAMFLCAAWPTKKALYGFIVGECIHFAVAIWVAITWDLWGELACNWEYDPGDFLIWLICLGIYLAGHVLMVFLRLKANCVGQISSIMSKWWDKGHGNPEL